MKTLLFISLNSQCWSFIDKVVYSKILLSMKTAFLEVEKTLFAVGTLVPMFTLINPGPYTCSRPSKTFHVERNLKINCEKKCFC